jgi:hypothetical protein
VHNGYVCCFCGKGITKDDYAALHLIARNLWERETAQSVYAHSRCAEGQMAFGQMLPDALLEGTAGYSAQELIWGDDEARHVSLSRWGCFVIAALLVAGVCLLIRAFVL